MIFRQSGFLGGQVIILKMTTTTATDWKVSRSNATELFNYFRPTERSAVIAYKQATRGSLALRVEALFDPAHADKLGLDDNVSRRYIYTQSPSCLSACPAWPAPGLSIHEIIPVGVPCRVWFDLDGFDLSIPFASMIRAMNTFIASFLKEEYDLTPAPDQFCWSESTKDGVKNSLHFTLTGFYVQNNEVAMKALANAFIENIRGGMYIHDNIRKALLVPGVIDLAVYRRNASIRIIHSAKLTDETRVLRPVDDRVSDTAYYVTYVNTDTDTFIDVCGTGNSDGECPGAFESFDQLEQGDGRLNYCAAILSSALKRKSATVSRAWSRDGSDDVLCSVRGYRTCKASGTKVRHSHHGDVYFIVNEYLPYVVQKCHSAKCGKGSHKIDHKEGFFGPMARCKMLRLDKISDYLQELRDGDVCKQPVNGMPMAEKQKIRSTSYKHRAFFYPAKYIHALFTHYYNRFFCAITEEREFAIGVEYHCHATGQPLKRTAKSLEFLKQRSTVPFIKEWTESPRRREYQKCGFVPFDSTMLNVRHSGAFCSTDHTTEIVAHDKKMKASLINDGVFNQFCGLAVTHQQAWAYDGPEDEARPFIRHICLAWADGDQSIAKWILQWMASIYQRPWDRRSTGIVLQGEKGCGKGIIMQLLGRIMGEQHYWQIGNLNNLTGTYTHPKFMRALLGFVDEAYWGGDPKSANALKGIITEKRQDANVKYRQQEMFESYMNVVIASNNDQIVEYTRDNRRYQFLRVKSLDFDSDEHRNTYFRRLLDVPPIAVARFFLRKMCTCSFDDKKIFKSAGARDQLLSSLDPLSMWWFSMLNGSPDDDKDSADDVFQGYPTPVTVLRQRMMTYSRENGHRFSGCPTPQLFGRKLRLLCPGIGKSTRMNIGPMQQVSAFVLPPIDVCRRQFNERMGHEFEYDV